MSHFLKNPSLMIVIIGAVFFLFVLGMSLSGRDNKRKRPKFRDNLNYRNQPNYDRAYNGNRNRNNNLQNTHLHLNERITPFNDIKVPEALKNALEIVSKAQYSKRPLMNRSEYKLFRRLENHLEKLPKAQQGRLFSQVAMGEFIRSESDEAFRLINAKRVDFVIVDLSGEAVIVIEYQGAGHYQENAIERDAIKREACRKAGIEFLEFKKNYDELDFERVSRILGAHFARKQSRRIERSKTLLQRKA